MKRKRIPGFWLPALGTAVAILGIGWSGLTVRAVRESRLRQSRMARDLEEIREWKAALRRSEPMRDALLAARAGSLACPAGLFANLSPGAAAPSVREEPETTGEGLRIRRLELDFRDVSLPGFGAWLAACENLMPPWRATRIQIDARGAAAARAARIRVSLEGVEAAP